MQVQTTATMTGFAVEKQRQFDAVTSARERKARGHFGTPAVIAKFMAGMFPAIPEWPIRVLDPGAGVGILSAALCERVLTEKSPRSLSFELYENDASLIAPLRQTMSYCRDSLLSAGHEMDFVIRNDDFILANAEQPLFAASPPPAFHWAILNPPYFKLRKASPHAQSMPHVVHGQPNIYSLFMAVVAELLLPGGQMTAITPRSYFDGPYFKRFRNWLLKRMTVRHIHVFESRTEAFKEDAVLQENVILRAEKGEHSGNVIVTNSSGRDLKDIGRTTVAYEKVIDNRRGDRVVRVSTNRLDAEIIVAVDQLPQRFRNLGLEISTGPVVTFRAAEFLRQDLALDTAPLLWMHNVRPFVTQFPPKNGKPTHIVVSDSSKKLLLPAQTYVLLKRFTAKEEKRRIVAGIMVASDSYSKWIGLENHLNYIYRPKAKLSETEAFGIAAFFNSALVDRYFRAISGNTQVNATEIRVTPTPNEQTLHQLGLTVQSLETKNPRDVELAVGNALGLSARLIAQLVSSLTLQLRAKANTLCP